MHPAVDEHEVRAAGVHSRGFRRLEDVLQPHLQRQSSARGVPAGRGHTTCTEAIIHRRARLVGSRCVPPPRPSSRCGLHLSTFQRPKHVLEERGGVLEPKGFCTKNSPRLGGNRLVRGGGGLSSPFPGTPPLLGSRDGDPQRGPEVPPTHMAQCDPHNALIILRYVSRGKSSFKKNCLGRFAAPLVSHH